MARDRLAAMRVSVAMSDPLAIVLIGGYFSGPADWRQRLQQVSLDRFFFPLVVQLSRFVTVRTQHNELMEGIPADKTPTLNKTTI